MTQSTNDNNELYQEKLQNPYMDRPGMHVNPQLIGKFIDLTNVVEEIYDEKSEIDHVLDRPGMWVGSVINEIVPYPLYVPSKNQILVLNNIGYNAGMLKLIDEIISNTIDAHRSNDSLFKPTQMKVVVNIDGTVSVKDDGGIAVRLHKTAKVLLTEFLFGRLRTSGNYDDSKQRSGAGLNGLGSKLTNIFSKYFTVTTADGKHQVTIEWSNNMKTINKDTAKFQHGYDITTTNYHGTETKFQIDLERFDLDALDLNTIRILQKRCIDAAASNPGLTITFESDVVEGKLNSVWKFDTFEEYVRLYLTTEQYTSSLKFNNGRDSIIIVPENLGSKEMFQFGIVNGAVCSQGTHFKKVTKQIVDNLLKYFGENDMELITEKDILSKLSIFINTTIYNPAYASQDKKELAQKIDKHTLLFNDKFIKELLESELVIALTEYYKLKYAEQKAKELRKLNAVIKSTKTKKLIKSATSNPNLDELWLFEGNSASNGFRKYRTLCQSAYILRGKIINTFNLNRSQILENLELREVLAATGLQFNEPQKNIKNFKFDKLIFSSDMDFDGSHIAGLLLAFFGKHFPELFAVGKIYRGLSPIIICNNETSDDSLYFYTKEDFETFAKTAKNLSKYDIIYTKGLGGLSDRDYKEMLRNQKLIRFEKIDKFDADSISIWFDKATTMRKEIILSESTFN